jgi:hypothetical protein
MSQIVMDRLVFSSLSWCSPLSPQGISLCRSPLDGSFGMYLRAIFAFVLIFRRFFFLKDLRQRSRPPTMVIPFCAPEVAHLIDQGLEPVDIACGSSPWLRTNRPSSPSIVSRLMILVTSSPSCAVFRTSQISLALFNPCTLLYSS